MKIKDINAGIILFVSPLLQIIYMLLCFALITSHAFMTCFLVNFYFYDIQQIDVAAGIYC